MKWFWIGMIGVSGCLMGGPAHADCGPLLFAVSRLARAGDFAGAEREVTRVRNSGFDCRAVDKIAARRILSTPLLMEAERLRAIPVRRAEFLRRTVS